LADYYGLYWNYIVKNIFLLEKILEVDIIIIRVCVCISLQMGKFIYERIKDNV